MNQDAYVCDISTLATLSSWRDHAYKHERDFLNRFARGGLILLSISWDENNMYLVVINEYAHKDYYVVDINEWFDYLKNIS